MEGNLMKMREALVIAMKAICHHARANHTCNSLAWENSTINANCGDILCAHRDLCEAKTAIQKALSAPPRACDVMSEENLTKVVSSGIAESIASRQEFAFEGLKVLIDVVVASAVKCAYDTQLISKGEKDAK